MNKTVLILPLLAVALGACGTTSPMTGADAGSLREASAKPSGTSDQQAATTLKVEPLMRISDGVAPEEAAYQKGRQHLAAHRFDAAIVEFGQALAINPKLTNAYVGVGVAQSMANRQPLAIAAFNEAVALDPNNPQWHANLGMAYARSGMFESARAALAKAWALAPDNRRIEAQYQRVSETALQARLAAERDARKQAQVAASGMTIISANGQDAGMRQVGTRVYELSLQNPGVPMNMAARHGVAADASVSPLKMAAAGGVTAQTGSSVPTPTPATPAATTLPLVYQGPTQKALPAERSTSISTTDHASPVAEASPTTVNRKVETPVDVPTDDAAQIAMDDDTAQSDADAMQASVPVSAFSSPEEALELARQRLFERRLAAARIRAARTAMIGLEDEAVAATAMTR